MKCAMILKKFELRLTKVKLTNIFGITNQLSRRRENSGFTYRPCKISTHLGRCSLPRWAHKEMTMTELKWLDGYSGQTTIQLIVLKEEYRSDSLVLAFEQALDQKAERVGKEALTEEERVVLAIEALEREVNNGGYGQFFTNSSNEYASIVVNSLNRIGCVEIAKLTQQAIDCLEIEGPLCVETIERAMEIENEERDEKLSQCDDQYYDIAGDLADPLLEFITINKDKINLS